MSILQARWRKGSMGGKKPLVSCDKYDEEERKALFGKEKDPEGFPGQREEQQREDTNKGS